VAFQYDSSAWTWSVAERQWWCQTDVPLACHSKMNFSGNFQEIFDCPWHLQNMERSFLCERLSGLNQNTIGRADFICVYIWILDLLSA
jgi:hypothetical protein